MKRVCGRGRTLVAFAGDNGPRRCCCAGHTGVRGTWSPTRKNASRWTRP